MIPPVSPSLRGAQRRGNPAVAGRASDSWIATATTSPRNDEKILLIGYGNPGRQDDGLGPAAVAAIADLNLPGVSTLDNYQLVVEDAFEVAQADIVWFIDASRDGDAPVFVRRLQPAYDASFTSHLLKPEALLALVQMQFGKTPEAWLMGIAGHTFDFAEGLSPEARLNLHAAIAVLNERLGVEGVA